MIISKTFRFEASHVLPKHPGKCSRLHGHSWELKVSVAGPVNPETGFVLDYAVLKEKVQPLIDKVDHAHLGCSSAQIGPFGEPKIYPAVFGPSFYPSSENLLKMFWSWLAPEFENTPARLYSLTLNETCTSAAVYFGD